MSNKQRLVLSIIDFLNQSIEDGTVKQDDQESLEVAIQCIGEAFAVDPSDSAQREKLSIQPATLQNVFDVVLKTREKVGAGSAAAAPPTPAAPAAPTAEDKANAEKLKAEGNAKMSAKQYSEAIDAYTKAIALDPTNAVYYSNRAAAYSSKEQHSEATLDAQKAIEVDPNFVKAYHRLGHAQYCLGDYNEAAAAFRRGVELDPSNASLKSGLKNAEARIAPEDDLSSSLSEPEASGGNADAAGAGLGGMADMLRNLGGGGGGGMPDLANLMNNPMMMQMAQQMMGNGGLDRVMQNPALANMMNRVQQGGGMPSMAELMADPTMRDMAQQFGAGGAP
ncbi:TPR-like protein [Rhodofomes roseus]|uniref:TPR-like protein n=1 Tax=Rhodofomes roseus TaxID=34475 RepID=A0ABQ8KFE3_9APHY|nr:TPR-like protein [Rhodofomes roseus]KAH9836505.1 TPR-like protein [Rhodofomes roseus]